MRMNSNKGVVLTAMALVAVVIFVAPVMAQVNPYQPAAKGVPAAGIALSTIQAGVGGGGMSAGSLGIGSGSMSAASMGNNNGQTDTCMTCGECLFLDTYNPNNTYNAQTSSGDPVINTVATSSVLTAGEPYVLTISGTVSYWATSAWLATTIGSPEPFPMFLSPTVPTGSQGNVGFDWEYLFAYPNDSHGNILAGGPVHVYYQGISVDNGATFNDLVPLAGQVYNPHHVYQYLVVGTGQKAQVRISDSGPHSDNYGEFKVCFQHLTPCPIKDENPGGRS